MAFNIRSLMTEGGLTPEERRALLEDLFVFGKQNQTPYLLRMSVLLVLSTTIATGGLLSDSAGVVIGAMLVAPMMNPVMAAAGAVAMGWSTRFYRSLWLVTLMGIAATALAAFFTFLAPEIVFIPEQVLARTKPTFFDLFIALAAGSAGAYTITRKETAAIPGVAVAVALLPPLASSGILLVSGYYELAVRAVVLFLTNLFSMVLSGALTFIAVGATPPAVRRQSAAFIRNQIGLFALLILAVSYPLYTYSQRVLFDSEYRTAKSEVIQSWLKENRLTLTEVEISEREGTLYMGLEGPNPPIGVSVLHERLTEEMRRIGRIAEGTNPKWYVKYTWRRKIEGQWPPETADIDDAADDDRAVSEKLAGAPWLWEQTQYDIDRGARAPNDDAYRIAFDDEGAISVSADCGTKKGKYHLRGRTLVIDMDGFNWFACRGNDDLEVFIGDLERSNNVYVEQDVLHISLVTDSGIMHFRRDTSAQAPK